MLCNTSLPVCSALLYDFNRSMSAINAIDVGSKLEAGKQLNLDFLFCAQVGSIVILLTYQNGYRKLIRAGKPASWPKDWPAPEKIIAFKKLISPL